MLDLHGWPLHRDKGKKSFLKVKEKVSEVEGWEEKMHTTVTE